MKRQTSKPVSGLESHIGFWLRWVSNYVSQSFARKLAGNDISVAQWVILREIFDAGEASPSLLAKASGLTRGAVSKIVDRLLDKGLVNRTEAAGDRRFQEVTLTSAGRALLPKLAALADQNEEEFFSRLSSQERENLVATLKKLVTVNKLKRVPTT